MQEGSGRTALVTGASAGIGKAFAELLAEKGYTIVLTARRGDRLDALAAELKQKYRVATHTIVADLSQPAASRQIVDELASRGLKVDLLVNNAGYGQPGSYADVPWADHERFMQVMVSAVLDLTYRLLPGMVERGWGRIINISSVNGQKGQFGQTNYSTAKAGIHGFTMSLAQEVATKGVTVNTVSPGYIGTDMVKSIRPDVLEKIVATIPVRRLGSPEEIGSIVTWLASEDSGFATGADFSLNGGLHMG